MTIDLGRAIRAATGLTRSQDLAGATKVIQEALSRVPASSPPQADEGDVGPPPRTTKRKPAGASRRSHQIRAYWIGSECLWAMS